MYSVFLVYMKQMNFEDSKRMLRKQHIRVVDSEVAASPTHAVKIAQRIGFPVVLKIDSSKIIHKTDVGGVMVNLNSPTEVFGAYNKIMRKAKEITEDINGIVVQEQAIGIEVIIGAKRDPQFGPVVLFGLGGIFVELMKDVSMRIMPFTRQDVKQMIKEIKGYPMLTGVRGGEKINFTKLEDTILRIGTLMIDNPEIKEMDLNPCFVNKTNCIVADVRLMHD